MILLCGIPSETPLRLVARLAQEQDAAFVIFNQRDFANCAIRFEVGSGEVTGELQIGSSTYRLEDFRAAYPRMMDDRCLPELSGEPDNSPLRGSAVHFTTR